MVARPPFLRASTSYLGVLLCTFAQTAACAALANIEQPELISADDAAGEVGASRDAGKRPVDGGVDATKTRDAGNARETSVDSETEATCTGVAAGQTLCANDAVVKCGSNGTTSVVKTCGAHQSCAADAGHAACSCNADPSCRVPGPTCGSGASSLVTCSTDVDGCLYAGTMKSCTIGPCYGDAGAAECCEDTCTTASSSCSNNAYTSCTADSNGCLQAFEAPCSGGYPVCVASQNSCGCNVSTDCAASDTGHVCITFAGGATCGCGSQEDCPSGWCCGTENPDLTPTNYPFCLNSGYVQAGYTCTNGTWTL